MSPHDVLFARYPGEVACNKNWVSARGKSFQIISETVTVHIVGGANEHGHVHAGCVLMGLFGLEWTPRVYYRCVLLHRMVDGIRIAGLNAVGEAREVIAGISQTYGGENDAFFDEGFRARAVGVARNGGALEWNQKIAYLLMKALRDDLDKPFHVSPRKMPLDETNCLVFPVQVALRTRALHYKNLVNTACSFADDAQLGENLTKAAVAYCVAVHEKAAPYAPIPEQATEMLSPAAGARGRKRGRGGDGGEDECESKPTVVRRRIAVGSA
ncbi:unnamed protein product [Pedinophyceae sp. YPF-701]|nr:unnamed protein product [Pedinophyceae sp. YPF-701]